MSSLFIKPNILDTGQSITRDAGQKETKTGGESFVVPYRDQDSAVCN